MSSAPILRLPSPSPILSALPDRFLALLPTCKPSSLRGFPPVFLLTPLDSALTDSCARKSFRIRSCEKTWGEGGTSRNPIEDFCPERPAGARDLSSFPTRDFPFSRLHCRPSAVDSQLPLAIHSQHGYFAAAFTLAPRAAQPGLDGIGR